MMHGQRPTRRWLVQHGTETAVSGFSAPLSGFKMDEEASDDMVSRLKVYAQGVVEAKANEEAGRFLIHMTDRYTEMSYFILTFV